MTKLNPPLGRVGNADQAQPTDRDPPHHGILMTSPEVREKLSRLRNDENSE